MLERLFMALREISLDQQIAVKITDWLSVSNNRSRFFNLNRPMLLSEAATMWDNMTEIQRAAIQRYVKVKTFNSQIDALVGSSLASRARTFERRPVISVPHIRTATSGISYSNPDLTNPFVGLPSY